MISYSKVIGDRLGCTGSVKKFLYTEHIELAVTKKAPFYGAFSVS